MPARCPGLACAAVRRRRNNLAGQIKTYGKERFAFGTHSPILDYLTGLLRVESLRPTEADAATKELIRSGNARRMIGI